VVHTVTIGWPQRPGFASARQLLIQDRGGDVDLTAMPQPVVNLIRRAWLPVLNELECAIHGDLGAGNVLVNDDHTALIDWDEARVDVPAFDYAHLPPEITLPVAGRRTDIVTAGVAWETATCWVTEPDYARRRLAELRNVIN
jgi:aminoglycoside phosphotransferase (APT) family kinase protein